MDPNKQAPDKQNPQPDRPADPKPDQPFAKKAPPAGDTPPQKMDGGQRNEGEGNKTAAREYNNDTTRFAESGKVEEKAREAVRAIDGPEGQTLRDAKKAGKARAAEEDPALRH